MELFAKLSYVPQDIVSPFEMTPQIVCFKFRNGKKALPDSFAIPNLLSQ